jgi:serine/threonine protein kinase
LDITTKQVKLSDYCFARSMERMQTDSNSKGFALLWSAPEAIQKREKFSDKSDVWSLGVTIWEIFSNGETPHAGVVDVLKFLLVGNRLKKPQDCPEDIYNIFLVQGCWKENPEERYLNIYFLLKKLQTFCQ